MRNPFRIRLQILGIMVNDEKEYFQNPGSFEKNQTVFPLNNNGQSLGIYLNRLEYYIRNNYMKEGKDIKGKLTFTFFNYILNQFVDISDLFCIDDNFIKLDGQFFQKDENSPQVLIIKLKFQIYYQEYLKFQYFLESINLEKKNLEENIQQSKNKLTFNKDNLIQFKQKIDELQQIYQIQPQYPQIDIAILYSHPLVNQNDKRITPVQFHEDIQNFKQKISELNKKVTYLITQANKVNLYWVLKYNPKIIHIISHGEHVSNKQCQYLQFEKNCMDDQVFTQDLERIMKNSKKSLVFLACCFAGEIAKNIKEHATTIAIDKELKMLDDAGIYYFQHLYQELLSNSTLQQSHEKAKEFVKKKLGAEDQQCCCSHSHRKACQDTFLQNGLCFFCLTKTDDCCRKSNQFQDKLSHVWGEDLNEKCKSLQKQILKKLKFEGENKLQNEQLEKEFLEKLNNFAQNGILRVCCCELAEKHKDELISEIQHMESEKFQIFQSKPNQSKIFENVEEGQMTEINNINWEEQYFIAWKIDAQVIYQLLTDNFYFKKNKKIIVISAGSKRGEEIVVKYAHQVSKYFKYRKLKFYKKNEMKDIQIIEKQLNNIEELIQMNFEERIRYIFIIYQINEELFKQTKVQLIELNLKGAVILISDSDIDLDSNFIKRELTDWHNTNQIQEKNDYYKILSVYGDEIRKKIEQKFGEEKLKDMTFDKLLEAIQEELDQNQKNEQNKI
ncbi:unnamed protein product [Paramecium sonneborni]|uniref:CHAT domain-containing protein n=1 Tax=Paramecium sonneborni TaxID=65129 RepID=A0A8S1R806_9CILI|nr:unnamed protein product [Paramecium sonneborni]